MCSTIVITKLVTNLFESQTLTFHIRRSLVTILVETCLGRFLVSRQEIVCELTILWAFTVGGGKTSNHDVAGRQTEPTSLLQIDEIKRLRFAAGWAQTFWWGRVGAFDNQRVPFVAGITFAVPSGVNSAAALADIRSVGFGHDRLDSGLTLTENKT